MNGALDWSYDQTSGISGMLIPIRQFIAFESGLFAFTIFEQNEVYTIPLFYIYKIILKHQGKKTANF